MQGRFKGKPPGGLGAHVGGCGCVRAFGQRCPGSEKIYGFVGKTVGHPPCGNFSPRWALAGRYGSLMVFPSTGVLLAVPCLCRGHPDPCWPAEALVRSRWPPGYAASPGGAQRVPGDAPGLSCGAVAPGIPARVGGPLRGAQPGSCWPAEALICSRRPWVCPLRGGVW